MKTNLFSMVQIKNSFAHFGAKSLLNSKTLTQVNNNMGSRGFCFVLFKKGTKSLLNFRHYFRLSFLKTKNCVILKAFLFCL